MIKIEYNRTTNTTKIFTGNLSNIMVDEKIKVEFKNIITEEIHYSVVLGSDCWCTWVGAELITDVLFYDMSNKLIYEYKWDILRDGDTIEKYLYLYLNSRKVRGIKSNGLVIGTHDGRNGHWIYSIKDRLSSATLIDGSEKQFSELTKNYSEYKELEFINKIVTVDGGVVTWYQGGEGYTDTVKSDLIKDWLPETEITQKTMESISFRDLIKNNNYDWIHLDVEGIDGDLILSLEKLPNIIIYESMNLDLDMSDRLDNWFKNNNYLVITENGNTIAKKYE